MQDEFSSDHFIEILEALHNNQKLLVKILTDLDRISERWAWIWQEQGRGSYEWDDSEFYSEFTDYAETINARIAKAFEETNRAHEFCCGRYRHLSSSDRTSVQMRLNFGYEDYADFVEEVMKVAALEL
jgi:hypothetical protein